MKTEWGKKAKKATAVSLAALMAFGMFTIVPAFAANDANFTATETTKDGLKLGEAPDGGYRAFQPISITGDVTATLLNEDEALSADQTITLELTGSYTPEGSTKSIPIDMDEQKDLGTGTIAAGATSTTIPVEKNTDFTPKKKGTYDLKVVAESGDMNQVTVKTFDPINVKDKFDEITFAANPASGAAVGQKVTLSTSVKGYNNNISYNFYAEKDGKKVSLLEEKSDTDAGSKVSWTPTEEGTYKLTVDAIDGDNKNAITTKTLNYEVKDWYFNIEDDVVFATQEATIAIDDNTDNAKDAKYSLATRMVGETYWTTEKENQNVDVKTGFKWTPNEVGKYELRVTKSISGQPSSEKVLTIEAKDGWKYESFAMKAATGVVGTPINVEEAIIKPEENFDKTLLNAAEYKLVYQKDNWATWGIAQDMTALGGENQPNDLKAIQWYPKEAGEYTLYLDIKASPNSETYKTQTFKVTISDKWSYESVQAQAIGDKQVKVSPVVQEAEAGALTGAEYKYVWKLGTAADGDWSSWGVAKQFTTGNNEEIVTLPTNGTYTIYVDIMDISGNIQTKTVEVNV